MYFALQRKLFWFYYLNLNKKEKRKDRKNYKETYFS